MSVIQENTVTASEDTSDNCLGDMSSQVGLPQTPPSIEKHDVEDILPTSTTTGVEDLEPTLESKHNLLQDSILSNGSVNIDKNGNEDMKHDDKISKQDCSSEFYLNSPLAVWMKKQNVNNSTLNLIYWKDVKKTGIVFSLGLLILIALTYCSIISVFSNLGLYLLLVSFLFRVGMTIVNAVQKTTAEHPLKGLLETELEIPVEKASQMAEKVIKFINTRITTTQRLFLINDVVDSLKFGLILWLFTYVGAWFSLMTMLIISFVGVFTVPKLYEEKQKEIDQLFEMVSNKAGELHLVVESKLPEKVKMYLKTKKE